MPDSIDLGSYSVFVPPDPFEDHVGPFYYRITGDARQAGSVHCVLPTEARHGNYVGGVLVLAGYFLIVSNIDNLLRPRLVSKEAYLSFALVLLSALGGYELFGFFGVVYGPVLMILFLTVLEVYETYYSHDEPPTPLILDERPLVEGE